MMAITFQETGENCFYILGLFDWTKHQNDAVCLELVLAGRKNAQLFAIWRDQHPSHPVRRSRVHPKSPRCHTLLTTGDLGAEFAAVFARHGSLDCLQQVARETT